jgi:oligopeptide/dipeptide ABC transporter ATP-binding protein
LLVADEPTTALDVTIQSEILSLLEELRRRLGMTMLLISHDLGVVSTSCERIYVMYAGRLIEWGDARAVFDQPAHPYTIGLMRSAEARRNRQGRFDTIGGDVPNLARLRPGCPFRPRCERATEICVQMPDSADYGEGVEHRLRCWHAGEAAPGSEMEDE